MTSLDNNTTFKHALDGTDYLPGLVGLNNIKNTDWFNVVAQVSIINNIGSFSIILFWLRFGRQTIRLSHCNCVILYSFVRHWFVYLNYVIILLSKRIGKHTKLLHWYNDLGNWWQKVKLFTICLILYLSMSLYSLHYVLLNCLCVIAVLHSVES